jgi:hypothetical protein
MAHNETNQMPQNIPQTSNRGERIDIHQNIGAQRRPDGSPDTSFDMETGIQGEEEERQASAATQGAVPGAIHNPATTGTFGSGPINTGPGTSGGTRSINTSGNTDTMGQTSAGAGDWSRTGGAGAGTMSNPGMTDTTDLDEFSQNNDEFNRETGMAERGVAERDQDRRHGVGNRATYISEEPKDM